MKVARKHILAALDNEGRLTWFKKYAIKAYPYTGKKSDEFGWTITVLPRS